MKKMENTMIAVFWDDGVLDMMAALSLMGIGLFWMAGLLPIGAFLPGVCVVLWEPLQVQVIRPRKGTVVFKPSREKTWKLSLIALVTTGLGILVLVGSLAVVQAGEKVQWAAALPLGIVSVLLVTGGFLTKLSRLFVYALVVLLSGIAAAGFDFDPWISFIVSGGLILGPACYVLVRFLRQSSRLAGENDV